MPGDLKIRVAVCFTESYENTKGSNPLLYDIGVLFAPKMVQKPVNLPYHAQPFIIYYMPDFTLDPRLNIEHTERTNGLTRVTRVINIKRTLMPMPMLFNNHRAKVKQYF